MKYLRHIGLVFSLLFVGVLGGLTAPLSSEAATLTIAGVDVSLLTTTGTGEGQRYTCETGYTLCWYITSAPGATRTIGGWVVGDLTTGNRARVRIGDVSGAGSINNYDRMNMTGATFKPVTPNANSAVTMHVVIKHTYTSGNTGDYYWSIGVTGQFNPPSTENVVDDHFILTGTGAFNSSSDIASVGTLDKGALLTPTGNNLNGVFSSPTPVVATKVKTSCNTNSTGVCNPSITYDFQVSIKGADVMEISDSLIGAGRACTTDQVDPLIPPTWIPTMNWVDNQAAPHIPLPTHVSGMHDWFVAENAKYIQNPLLRQAVTNFETNTVNKWLAKNTCTGVLTQAVVADAAAGAAANGQPNVTTCVDTNTCGTIVIKKTIASCLTGYDENCTQTGHWPIPQDTQTFGFDGSGSGIYPFSITTDGQICSDSGCTATGSHPLNSLATGSTVGGRTISETVFPTTVADPDLANDPRSHGTAEAHWYTKTVSCKPASVPSPGTEYTTHNGVTDNGIGDLTGRSGYVTVSNLAPNDTLTCTFENGIFEIEGGG
jgi:hypothetical protein